jgi:MipA family protein
MRSPSRFIPFAGVFVAVLGICDPALAQNSLTSPEPVQNWNLTIGGGVRYTPDYLGSNDYSVRPRVIVSVGRGLGSRWWKAEDDAIGLGLFQGENWRAGLSGALVWQREASSNIALRGLGNVDFGIEAGAFGEYYVQPWLRARVDIRRGFFAHEAMVADLKLDAFGKLNEKISFGLGPRLSLASTDYFRTYYGVSLLQSANSGYAVSRPPGGLLSVGALAQATYFWTPRLQTTAYVEYKRLAGDAAKAAIVKREGSANQFTFGLSTSWTVDLGI